MAAATGRRSECPPSHRRGAYAALTTTAVLGMETYSIPSSTRVTVSETSVPSSTPLMALGHATVIRFSPQLVTVPTTSVPSSKTNFAVTCSASSPKVEPLTR